MDDYGEKVDREIVDHYESQEEETRLSGEAIEKIRTKEIIQRFVTAAGTILDMGGAAGVYSFWLAELGHTVHLVDPTPKHIQAVHRLESEYGVKLASATRGDARRIDFPDDTFDVVLFMGPLYHLVDKKERLAALGEARRVLKPGGTFFAAAIGRYASTIDGFRRDIIQDPDYVEIMMQDMSDGLHRNKTGKEYFTTSYFHTYKELQAEIEEAGFAATQLFAVEGISYMVPDLKQRLEDARYREVVLDVLRRLEQTPELMGFTAHLLAVARNPDSCDILGV